MFAILFGSAAAVVIFILAVVSGRRGTTAFTAAAIGGICQLIVSLLVIDLFMNPIIHPLDALPLILSIFVVSGTVLFFPDLLKDSLSGTFISIVLFCVFWMGGCIYNVTANPVEFLFCEEHEFNDMVATFDINVSATPVELADVNPNLSVVTDEDMARSMASDTFGEYSTYLQLDTAQHVEEEGQPYIVVDIIPRTYSSFNQAGGSIPGYYLVVPTEISSGADHIEIPMYIVPGLEAARGLLPIPWTIEQDLYRRVYSDVLLPNRYQALGLEKLELGPDNHPYFTALLVRPLVGTTGYMAHGFIVVDPTIDPRVNTDYYDVYPISHTRNERGQIIYDVSQVPEWVNNVFPEEYFTWMITEWGYHANHTLCLRNGGNLGRYIMEREHPEDKYLADGHRIYQYYMTSMNADSAMTQLLYADPRTGKIVGYETKGDYALPNIESVESGFRQVTRQQYPPDGAIPTETEVTKWAGKLVFTTVLKTVSQTNNSAVGSESTFAEHTYAKYGVVLASADATRNHNNFIVADSPEEAYLLFLDYLVKSQDPDANRTLEASLATVQGTVTAVGQIYQDGSQNKLSFIVVADTGETYRFTTVATAESTLLAAGHRVIVTALTLQVEGFTNTTSVTNLSLVPR